MMKPIAFVYIFTIISMSAEMGWILTKGSRNPQTFSFIVCQFLLNIWSAAQLLQLSAVNDKQLFIAYSVGNTGICWIGTAWLALVFYTVFGKFPRPAAFVSIIFSAVMWIFSLTNSLHNLFYSSFSMDGVTHGILFCCNFAYTYLSVLIGTFLLCRSLENSSRKRQPIILLVLSAVIPLVSNVLFMSGIISSEYDITPLAFSVSSVLVLLATNRFGFLNVKDIAFESALESISDGTAVFRNDGSLIFANSTMRTLFSLDPNSALSNIFPDGNMLHHEREINGRIISVKPHYSTNKHGERIAVTVVASDITDYHKMIAQNQQLADAREKLSVEAERNRIAQEVHDTTGHTLTMINSLAKLIGISLKNGDIQAVEDYAHEAQELSGQGIAQLRVSINNLRRRSENSLITDGLNELARSARGIAVELCIQGDDSTRYSYCSNVIYENTREAITNCLKYAEADRMDIIVKLLPDSAEVYIFDNGKGCTDISPNNGLKGMRERTEKIGGSIRFSAVEGSGFSITMKFPITNQNNVKE